MVVSGQPNKVHAVDADRGGDAADLARQLEVARQDLLHKSNRLAELSESAHRFVEDVAHDFRTPLTVIQEFASIMADGIGGEVNEKQTEFLGLIACATRDLAQLVDDFLDSGKLRAGTLRVDRRPHPVAGIIDGCFARLSERARAHEIELVREPCDDLPEVYVDADRARRVLTNLVVNAIKTAPPGTRVVVGAAPDGADAVRLSVADHGATMTDEHRGRVLECLRPGNVFHTKETKGFGLGLSVVGQLSSINLGAASVRSEEGTGNVYSFTMPIARTGVIVRRYLSWIASMGESSSLCALRVREATPEGAPDDLLAFLASVSRATDLILRTPDGEGFVVCGIGYKPDEWTSRIATLYAESALRSARPDRGPLSIDTLGTRDIRDAEQFLHDHLTPHVEARPHA